jgi:DNA-directed RNA polymerase subunit beta
MAEILKQASQRINFGKNRLPDATPDLLDIQLASYKEFVQLETTAENRSKVEGLHKVFQENFPISDSRNIFLIRVFGLFC